MDDQDTPEPDAQTKAKPRRGKAAAHDGSTQTMNWYDRTPVTAQMFMQFGFAGMFVVVFMIQFRDSAQEARANRDMYRDEQAAMRAEISKVVETERLRGEKVAVQMTEVVFELKRTTDALRTAGLKLEKAAEKMEFETGVLPMPRSVTGPGGSP